MPAAEDQERRDRNGVVLDEEGKPYALAEFEDMHKPLTMI